MQQEAKSIADTISSVAGGDLAAQANLIAQAARNLGMACVVFTQEDCPNGVELSAISRDLEETLVTRGNEFIDQQSSAL